MGYGSLTKEEAQRREELFKKDCGGYSDELDGIKFNGVDRIDSSQGYTVENSVPCCGVCNQMKMSYDLHDFLEHVKAITNYTFGMED